VKSVKSVIYHSPLTAFECSLTLIAAEWDFTDFTDFTYLEAIAIPPSSIFSSAVDKHGHSAWTPEGPRCSAPWCPL
jgi:hypothetical protein